MRPSEDKEGSQCLTCARIATVSLWKTTFGGSLGENPQSGGAQLLGEKYAWRQPKRLLVVQTGDSFEQAKVFKAHAVPQNLCANLIIALKLLANQQEDGDCLLQNIVEDLGKESRRGLTDGLREFTRLDNERALDAVIVRESPDELTLSAEEVGTSKVLIDVHR